MELHDTSRKVIAQVIFSLFLFVIRPWIGGHEIHYRADIGKRLYVLHPSLGIVVSAATTAGQNLVLTGGNCIGGRRSVRHGDIIIGDNVNLGANTVILGPIRLGNNIQIGAGAVVIHDAEDGQVLVGVPATAIFTKTS